MKETIESSVKPPSNKKRRATMRDVAAAAEVSISTVSLYLHGNGGVAPHTGQRIATAVDKLGYIPNPRTKNGQKSAVFGLLMEKLSPMAFPETIYGGVIRAIESNAKEHGYSMMVATVEEGQMPKMVRERQVQGAIVLGGCPANDALAIELFRLSIPLVLVDNYVTGYPIDAITPDNEWGGYSACKHLIALGHTRIGIIEGPPKYRTLTDRLWGALRAAEESGITVRPEYRQPSISSGYPKKGYREMKVLLTLPQPPTAVFAVSDRAAIGALEAIKDAGLDVPADISLLGFDDEVYSEHANPPLTTVHYAGPQMGQQALDRLIGLIDGTLTQPVRTSIYTKLLKRKSTAPYIGGR